MSDIHRLAVWLGFQDKRERMVTGTKPFEWFIYPNGRHSNGDVLDDWEVVKWILPKLAKELEYLEMFHEPTMGWGARDHTDEGLGGDLSSDYQGSFSQALFKLALIVMEEKK